MKVSDAGWLVLQIRQPEIVCDVARSSSPSSYAHKEARRTKHMGLPASQLDQRRTAYSCEVMVRPSVSYCIVYEDSRGICYKHKHNTKTPTSTGSLRRVRCLLRRDQVCLPLLPTILRISIAHGHGGLQLGLGYDAAPCIQRHRRLLERTSFDILISS